MAEKTWQEVEAEGGPAFGTRPPTVKWDHDNLAHVECYGHAGMTLRDWFAGMALMGLASFDALNAEIAHECYSLADAMLLARNDKINDGHTFKGG